jgi:hypothetical protein
VAAVPIGEGQSGAAADLPALREARQRPLPAVVCRDETPDGIRDVLDAWTTSGSVVPPKVHLKHLR